MRFVRWARFFERNCIVNWVIFLARFCWLWDFLPENLKLIDKLQICGFKSFIVSYKFRYNGTILGHFSQCNLNFFVAGQPWWPTFLLKPKPPPNIKKFPTTLLKTFWFDWDRFYIWKIKLFLSLIPFLLLCFIVF